MATVKYNGKTISDQNVKDVLQKIADAIGKDVNITSGDRGSVPKGGSKTSHHLAHRAADFWVTGTPLATAYKTIKDKASEIFDKDERYQVIHHGTHTSTGGAHLHLGRYSTGSGVKFCTEGLTKATSGSYSCTSVAIK